MLGPFRPILIAIGMKGTGIGLGVLYMVAVLVTILVVRPRLLAGNWLPYFGRLSVLLALVVLVQVTVLLFALHLGFEPLVRTALFPIVVLTLAADGFARALSDEGRASAIWRGGSTLTVALAVLFIDRIPGFGEVLIRFPELVLVEIGLILLFANALDYRLLRNLNPPVVQVSRAEEGQRQVCQEPQTRSDNRHHETETKKRG